MAVFSHDRLDLGYSFIFRALAQRKTNVRYVHWANGAAFDPLDTFVAPLRGVG